MPPAEQSGPGTGSSPDLRGMELEWRGTFASSEVNRLHAETVKAMQTPDTRSKLEGLGADGTASRSPEEFAALVRSDTARYAKIVKEIGLRID